MKSPIFLLVFTLDFPLSFPFDFPLNCLQDLHLQAVKKRGA